MKKPTLFFLHQVPQDGLFGGILNLFFLGTHFACNVFNELMLAWVYANLGRPHLVPSRASLKSSGF